MTVAEKSELQIRVNRVLHQLRKDGWFARKVNGAGSVDTFGLRIRNLMSNEGADPNTSAWVAVDTYVNAWSKPTIEFFFYGGPGSQLPALTQSILAHSKQEGLDVVWDGDFAKAILVTMPAEEVAPVQADAIVTAPEEEPEELDEEAKGTEVKLVYFKPSGKYYSTGTYYSQLTSWHEVVKEVRQMMQDDVLPELVPGVARGYFTVLITQVGENTVPQLLHAHP